MPRLNLKDDGMEEEPLPLDSDKTVTPPPTLRDVGGTGGGGRSTILLVFAVIVVLGAGVYALNYFKIIKLWGKKPAPTMTMNQLAGEAKEENPPPSETTTDQGTTPEAAAANAAPTTEAVPVPTVEPTLAPETAQPEKPKLTIPTSGTGNYTVQISSWASKGKADQEASKLTSAGYTAFVEDATVGGTTWYRVRVGRYGTVKEAKDAAVQLSKMGEETAWVAKVGG